MNLTRKTLSAIYLVACVSAPFAVLGVGQEAAAAENVAQEIAIMQDEIVVADARPVPDSEMGELRAGFWDVSGFLMKFAVDVEAQIDGALMFVRSLVVQPTVNGAMEASSTAKLLAENLPAGTTATVLEDGAGVVLSDQAGKQTALLNQSSVGALTNVIMNTADNVNVSQTMNVDLVLQNVDNLVSQVTAMKAMSAPAGLFQTARMHTIGFGL
jgi:hypothetical protein